MNIKITFDIFVNAGCQYNRLNGISFKEINSRNYYHYKGGYTTPNCDEVADWILIKDPLKISEDKVCFYIVIFEKKL